MTGEIDIYGVFVPGLFVWMALAFVLSLPVRRGLARLGLYRWVWHRPAFDLAVYIVLLQLVSLTAQRVLS